MPIQKQTIRTPWKVNALFFLLILIFAVPMALFTAKLANATPTARECRTAWEDGFFQRLEQSPCSWRFPIFTKQHIREMEQLQRYYVLPSNQY